MARQRRLVQGPTSCWFADSLNTAPVKDEGKDQGENAPVTAPVTDPAVVPKNREEEIQMFLQKPNIHH